VRNPLAILVLVLSFGACAAEQDKAPRDVGKGEETTTERGKKRPAASDDKGKKWGGWRWKGQRDDCFFRIDKGCFESFEKACKAARCGKRKCMKDGGAPARVYCEGDKPDKDVGKPAEGKKSDKKKAKGNKKPTGSDDEDEEDEEE